MNWLLIYFAGYPFAYAAAHFCQDEDPKTTMVLWPFFFIVLIVVYPAFLFLTGLEWVEAKYVDFLNSQKLKYQEKIKTKTELNNRKKAILKLTKKD